VIDDYSEPNVDTLHKKNLFSLGEDRYLTTLILKHFPTFKTKFNPVAIAHTMAPDSTRVLFSQRRRYVLCFCDTQPLKLTYLLQLDQLYDSQSV